MTFVVDSSVALAWCFEDERNETTDALSRQVAVSGAAAPGLWPLGRLALPLATRDRALRAAAGSLGVPLLGEATDARED